MFFKKNKAISFQAVREALSRVVDPLTVKGLQIKEGIVRFEIETPLHGAALEAQKRECLLQVERVEGVIRAEVQMKPKNAAPQKPQSQAHSSRITLPSIKHVVAIASGKGGVGKSTVAANLAVAAKALGQRVGLLDADIYGPSIPLMFGVKEERAFSGEDNRVLPIERGGIRLMSMGFLVPDDKPVIWRGPMVHGALTQFLTQVEWGDLDILFIDMPPGTGDAQLTISQSAPLSGAIIVTTPQEVSLIDARKGLQMFQNVEVPILGIIENMAGFACPHCEKVTEVFKKGGGTQIARQMEVPLLGSIPLDARVAEGGDAGDPITHQHPDSMVAKLYRRIAEAVIAQLSIQKEGSFKPLSLEWK